MATSISISTSTTPPTWRCACADCTRLTLQIRCDLHRLAADELLLAALASSASAAPGNTAKVTA